MWLGRCEEISATGLAHLSALKRLRKLNLSGCYQLDNRCLGSLSGYPALRVLDLGWSQYESLAGLAGCRTLEELRLAGSNKITDAAMKVVAALPSLKRIDLNYTEAVTPAGFATLAAAPRRKQPEIHLSGTYVTDAHLEALHGAVGLRKLSWYALSEVSTAALKTLRTRLEGTEFGR